MKNFKRMLAMIITVMMLATLALPALAADGTHVLTINGEKPGHTYDAYQIFSGTLDSGNVLTDIKWGDGIDGDAFLADLIADIVEITNADGSVTVTMGDYFTTGMTASQVASVIKDWTTNGDRLDRFAEIAGKHLTTTHKTSVEGDNNVYTISGLADGYYLVKDRQGVDEVLEEDFYTKYILSITTNTAIAVKGDYPTVVKEVGESLDSSYNKVMANQINKSHFYRWIGSLPSDLDEYDNYSYSFIDTMSAGLTFDRIERIFIVHSNNSQTPIYDYNNGNTTKVDAYYPDIETITNNDNGTTDESDDTTTITLGWTDLLAQYPNLKSSDRIVVKYRAHLDEDAIIGSTGNPNEVKIRYSNSPSATGYGESIPDEAIVYSFAMNVVKVDNDNTSHTLEGAEFVLYYIDVDAESNEKKMYAILNDDSKIQGWTEDISEATTLVSGKDGTFKVIGLQDIRSYYLHETKAPNNYNLLFSDVKVTLQYGTNPTTYELISLTYNVDAESGVGNIEDGSISVTVKNNIGTTLPSTGGIGTTIFYIVGTVLVLGAVVVLATKKRMSVNK